MTSQNFNIAAATPDELGLKLLEEVSNATPNLLNLSSYLAAKASTEQQNAEGLTPLLVATIANHTGAAQMLIAAGANTRAMDEKGDTPLMHAVHHQNLKVIRDLRTVGAPHRRMESSMSSEMWDRYMDSLEDKITAAEAQETTIGVLRPLKLTTKA